MGGYLSRGGAPAESGRWAGPAMAAALVCLPVLMFSCGQGEIGDGAKKNAGGGRGTGSRIVRSDGEAWPSFRGDVALTGVARSDLPDRPVLLWKRDVGAAVRETAAVLGGRIFVAVSDGRLLALDVESGKTIWSFNAGSAAGSAPCVSGGSVFFGTSDGTFYAVDSETGRERWKFKADAEIRSHPVACDGRVFFGSYDNRLYCLSQADGTEAWRFETEAPVHCGPCVAGEAVAIAGCDGFLRLFERLRGKELAAVELKDRVAASPAFDGLRFYVGTHGGRIICAGMGEKRILWERSSDDKQPFFASAAVEGERVIFAGRDGIIRCLRAGDGAEVWKFEVKSATDSSPAICRGRIFFGDKGGVLYALSLEDGSEKWRFEAGGSFDAGPAIGCDVMAIGSSDGMIYCFGKKTGNGDSGREKPGGGAR